MYFRLFDADSILRITWSQSVIKVLFVCCISRKESKFDSSKLACRERHIFRNLQKLNSEMDKEISERSSASCCTRQTHFDESEKEHTKRTILTDYANKSKMGHQPRECKEFPQRVYCHFPGKHSRIKKANRESQQTSYCVRIDIQDLEYRYLRWYLRFQIPSYTVNSLLCYGDFFLEQAFFEQANLLRNLRIQDGQFESEYLYEVRQLLVERITHRVAQ